MEARWPEREAGPLHPPSAEVKQAYVWIYTFISPMHLHGMVLINPLKTELNPICQ